MNGGSHFFRHIALQVHAHWKDHMDEAVHLQREINTLWNDTIGKKIMPEICTGCAMISLPNDPNCVKCEGCDRVLQCAREYCSGKVDCCNTEDCKGPVCHFCDGFECSMCFEAFCNSCIGICDFCRQDYCKACRKTQPGTVVCLDCEYD